MRPESYYGTGSGSVEGISLAKDAAPVSPAAARLGELQKSLAYLDNELDSLFGRLAPVLASEMPQVQKAGIGQPASLPNASALVSQLTEAVTRISQLANRVASIRERVEL